jgi:hypothetical protein
VSEAIQLGEATLTDCERILGPGHWDTLTCRANLAHAYHGAGQLKRASAQFDRALRDCEQSIGPDDPLTEQVRALRQRYLAGRQGAAPILAPPMPLREDARQAEARQDGVVEAGDLADLIATEGEDQQTHGVPRSARRVAHVGAEG